MRDLLAVEALPKEMDYSLLLPPDNSNSGFDNIADLLFVSPTAMESYLGAAEKISRLAVGDPAAPPLVNIYRVPDEQPQNVRVDGLPVGTRGGLAVRSYFPADGEYVVKVTFVGRSAEPEQVELSVDGARAQLVTSTARQAARAAKKLCRTPRPYADEARAAMAMQRRLWGRPASHRIPGDCKSGTAPHWRGFHRKR